ncbi:TOX high mobility group box family member 4-B [Synchiropus picturatus]
MDLNFYSGLAEGCSQNVEPEYMDTQSFNSYSEENKFAESSGGFMTISSAAHPFLSAEQTFHTPSLGDEVFEIPPISLDPDSSLAMGDAVPHFELSDGALGPAVSRSLVSNLVVEANDPSFASTFVNTGSQGLEQLDMGAMVQAGGGGLLSSSSLELGNGMGSHFGNSSPMTIDVQLADMGHGLLESGQLSTINQTELSLGLSHHGETLEQPLSATPSPADSLQDEDMDDFKRSVLVDSPMLSSVSSSITSHPAHITSVPKRSGGKPASLSPATSTAGAKKGKKKKDPNEPQKPVSAYALFFRDTQAAIKGQNPNASFGEVSKIVASMWDSLAEEQKQVYKRKTEMAKKEYLKALAAYRASQLSQPASEEMDTAPSPPPPPPPVVMVAPVSHQPTDSAVEENTITNICASNIILDVPEMATRSRTGANKTTPPPAALPAQTVTKIIIPKHLLRPGSQVVTMLPGGVCTVVPAAPRQPPPLQQMQNAPPPPRLQQMAPAPPPLQAKPREGSSASLPVATPPPPPLQIKIVPTPLEAKDALPIIVPSSGTSGATVDVPPATVPGDHEEDLVADVCNSDEDVVEVNGSKHGGAGTGVCVRDGCNKPAVESKDWDKEYCSNQCVADHCRVIFQTWCSVRNETLGTVK